MATSSFSADTLIFVALFLLILLRRAYALSTGVRFSLLPLSVAPAMVSLLFGVALVESLQLLPSYLTVLDLAIAGASS